MHWLEQRLKTLKMSQTDLSIRLRKRGISKTRQAISSWISTGHMIPMLGTPKEALILAEVLEWSVTELLLAAGYPIVVSDMQIPPILMPFIVQCAKMDAKGLKVVVKIIAFAMSLHASMNDEELANISDDVDFEADGD